MNKAKLNMNSILICIFELIIGILLLIDPVGFTAGVIIAFGVGLLILGLVNIFRYFRTEPVEAAKGGQLATGLIALLVGGFCAFYFEWIILTFPIITVLNCTPSRGQRKNIKIFHSAAKMPHCGNRRFGWSAAQATRISGFC